MKKKFTLLLLFVSLLVGCNTATPELKNTENETISQVETDSSKEESSQVKDVVEFSFLDEDVTCLNIKVGSTGQTKLVSDINVIREIDALLLGVELVEIEEMEDVTDYPIRSALYMIECMNDDKEVVSSICIYPDKITLGTETWIAENTMPVSDYIDTLYE